MTDGPKNLIYPSDGSEYSDSREVGISSSRWR